MYIKFNNICSFKSFRYLIQIFNVLRNITIGNLFVPLEQNHIELDCKKYQVENEKKIVKKKSLIN